MYLFDTNACIAYMRGNNEYFLNRCIAVGQRQILLCTIVQSELWHGIYVAEQSTERRREQTQAFFDAFAILPFDEQAAHEYGVIKAFVEPLEKKMES
jgi:tRNA(fMet)-specific endonuclease VapC